jgi:hypothetical protein
LSSKTSTGKGSVTVAVLLVFGVLAMVAWALFTNPEGPDRLPPKPENDNQVFVDLSAVWSPRGEVWVSYQLGESIHGPEVYTGEDPGRFGIREVVERGIEVVLVVEGDMNKTCEIRVNEVEQVVEGAGEGNRSCRVELTT